jgi:hypothetical protein
LRHGLTTPVKKAVMLEKPFAMLAQVHGGHEKKTLPLRLTDTPPIAATPSKAKCIFFAPGTTC